MTSFTVRQARTADVRAIKALTEPYVNERILLGKELVTFYEAVQEFRVAVDDATGELVGCGALHVLWEDLGEVRTLAAAPSWRGRGVGHAADLIVLRGRPWERIEELDVARIVAVIARGRLVAGALPRLET